MLGRLEPGDDAREPPERADRALPPLVEARRVEGEVERLDHDVVEPRRVEQLLDDPRPAAERERPRHVPRGRRDQAALGPPPPPPPRPRGVARPPPPPRG